MSPNINRQNAAAHKSHRKYVDTTLYSAINQGTTCHITDTKKNIFIDMKDGRCAREN